jgi:hypothetical protein
MDQQSYEAGALNFNLPHDVVSLPTGGIFYKNKKKSVKVGYLTAKDENILTNINSRDSNESILQSLIKNKLYEHDLKCEDLLDTDIEAILIFLRNTSFGPEYNLNLNDPKTGKPFNTTIILDELNIKKGKVLPDENGLFTTKLPKSGFLVKLKPLTFGETVELNNQLNSYPTGLSAPFITWKLSKQIKEINGNTDLGHIATTIDTLPIMDSKYIKNFLKENVPSLDLKKEVVSPSGEKVIVDITFGVEFFRPFF